MSNRETDRLLLKKTEILRYLLISFCLLGSSALFAQSSQWISASFNNTPLPQALNQLENAYPLTFSYDAQLVEKETISSTFEKLPLIKALENILSNTGLTFQIVDESSVLILPRSFSDTTTKDKNFICGQVLDGLTLQPLEFATVFLPKTKIGGSTDEAGFFELSGAFSSSDLVEVSYVGFEKRNLVVLDLQKENCVPVNLKQFEATLTDVIVTEENQRGISYTQKEPVQVLRPGKLLNLPGQVAPDVLNMVQLLPGISGSEESASGLHVRGGKSDENLVLFDGIPVYHSGHFFGLVSAFNSEVVDRVEVHKRGFSPRYGGRLSSVIDVQSDTKIPERVNAHLGMNFIYGQGALHIPLIKNKLSILASGRRSTSSLFSNPSNTNLFDQSISEGRIKIDEEEVETGDTLLPSYFFEDYNVKINWQPNEGNTITASFLQTKNLLGYNTAKPFESPTSDTLRTTNWGASVQWKHRWSDAWNSRLKGSYSTYKYFYFNINDPGKEEIDFFRQKINGLEEYNFSWENYWNKGDRHTLHFGYEYFHYKALRNEFLYDTFGSTGFFENEANQADLQVLYGNYHFSLPDLLQLSMGLRYNYYHPTNQHLIEPRFRVNLQLNPAWQIELNAGEYYQFVGQFIERNEVSGDEGNWIVAQSASNTGVTPPVMEGQHFSVGAFWKKNGYELSLEAYQKRTTGLSSFALRFGEYISAWNLGESQSKGFEVMLQKQFGKLQTLTSYTISKTDYSFLYWEDGQPFPAAYDQRHKLNLLANYSIGNWEGGIKWTINNGRPYTQAERLIFPEGVVDSTGRVIEYGFQNANRLPVYHRFDASLNYHFTPKVQKDWKLSLGLSLLNIYNRKNIVDRYFVHDYRWDGTKVVLSIREINKQGLPFTPNLSLRFRWH